MPTTHTYTHTLHNMHISKTYYKNASLINELKWMWKTSNINKIISIISPLCFRISTSDLQLTQILILAFEGKCLVHLIVTISSIFPLFFCLAPPESVSLIKSVCCSIFRSVCPQETEAQLRFVTKYQTTFSHHVCLLVPRQWCFFTNRTIQCKIIRQRWKGVYFVHYEAWGECLVFSETKIRHIALI